MRWWSELKFMPPSSPDSKNFLRPLCRKLFITSCATVTRHMTEVNSHLQQLFPFIIALCSRKLALSVHVAGTE